MVTKKGEVERVRVGFSLPPDLVSDLQAYVAELKRAARREGQLLPTMSSVVEEALRRELAQRKKKRR